MSTLAIAPELAVSEAVATAAHHGLASTPKTLPPWLFYDEPGSRLFEQITALSEYYLTRTERTLFQNHADEIFQFVRHPAGRPITIAELGAGTAIKTGILLRALTHFQSHTLYQPIDISPTALDEAHALAHTIPNLTVRPRTANYVTEPYRIHREPGGKILALYIGSSIGNFSPAEARAILNQLRTQLNPGDALLLGTDLAPSPAKPISTLLAAYNDASGITAAFNRNILARLDRELDADFDLSRFTHHALWNPTHSRIEMHLVSSRPQTVRFPASPFTPTLTLHFAAGETIHTENSYKFTPDALSTLLTDTGFIPTRTFTDPDDLYAITLASAL